MLKQTVKAIFGTKHSRSTKKIQPIVDKINSYFDEYEKLTDAELQAKTEEFKQRLQGGETTDDILPEAFAVVKSACKRLLGKEFLMCDQKSVWDMVPFDVQLIGGVVLHQGKIAEMATGEGKTLVATMPMYLNALEGKGVHLVTVNDYLARRDSEWMGVVYDFLGLTVGCIQHDMPNDLRKEAYDCDITYGTNNEFGFDYLRDNMVLRLEDRVQRGHNYAIVDEVDSVLIDEARTPLIISGPVAASDSSQHYSDLKPIVENLVRSQIRLVNSLVAEAEKLLPENEYDAGIKLLQASRGMPKNKRLLKIMKEGNTMKLINRVDADYMREKKRHELDEELYFAMDEKGHDAHLTDKGIESLSPADKQLFILPDISEEIHKIDSDSSLTVKEKAERRLEVEREFSEKSDKVHSIIQLLKAYALFEKDVEYVVQDGKVLIVDEFTGRLMPGRRYSDGMHQSIEAKEGVKVEGETQTLATITLQNYFRMYDKLAGMTGTAETEENEFFEIYKLEVVVIPTNKPCVREDYDDVVYKTRREKYNAIIDEIAEMHEAGRPVLVGTVSVEVSETLAKMLKRRGIRHNVLNAKHHQKEAEVIAQAGQRESVTIATNMAGRGTDIKLGPGIVDLGGLHILGTERHEARRIDRQLRGRGGRQGDPGSSSFFLSLDDDLMRLFGSDRIAGIMNKLGAEEGEVITHPLITKSIGRAQKRVEMRNFDIRKHLLEYDDVMNKQREVIYDLRLSALEGKNLKEEVLEIIDDSLEIKIDKYIDPNVHPDDWDIEGLREDLLRSFFLDIKAKGIKVDSLTYNELEDKLKELIHKSFEDRLQALGEERSEFLMQRILLAVIDEKWQDHLYGLDHLKSGIGFRAYGQKDPLIEYKKEAFAMFEELNADINDEIASLFFKAQLIEGRTPAPRQPQRMVAAHQSPVSAFSGAGEAAGAAQGDPNQQAARRPVKAEPKVGRNASCPCGSGKKYKKCHGSR